jgi:hypothetical protein
MNGWSVGMTVDQCGDFEILKGLADGILVDIHDELVLGLHGLSAFLTQGQDLLETFIKGLGKEAGLPVRVAKHLAHLLIFQVIGTQGVAMHDQYRASIKVDNLVVAKYLAA